MIEYENCTKLKTWYVYIHTNKINNKVYVGITCQEPTKRWGKDGSHYKQNEHFWRAICKYGWDNFEHMIFAEGLTKNEACHMEICLIALYRTNERNYGYNFTKGGEGTLGVSLSGEQAYWFGKTLSESHKNKVREHHADFNGGKHPRARAVYCVELKKTFDCIRDAQRELDIGAKDISKCCKGIRNTAGGFHWVYTDELNIRDINQISNQKRNAKTKLHKQVRCIETGVIYDSVTQAAIDTGADISSIAACCRGRLKTTHGFHWEFV